MDPDASLLVPLADEVNTIGSIIAPVKAALQCAWEQRGSYWQNCDDILLTSLRKFQTCESSLCTSGDALGEHLCDLTKTLRECYDSIGDKDVLLSAIAVGRASIFVCVPSHSHRAASCLQLADSLWTRYYTSTGTGDDRLLNEAIDLGREALRLYAPEHPDRVHACGRLAVFLTTQYKSIGDDRPLTEAITLAREALALRPLGHSEHARSCRNLSIALLLRHDSTGDNRPLMEATDLQRESLALCPPGHPDRALSCTNLASSLTTCYNKIGDICLLNEGIALEREALGLRPPGHPSRQRSCTNLANKLNLLYNYTDNDQYLSQAIDLQRESFALTPLGHRGRALARANLAEFLREWYTKTNDPSLIDEIYDLCLENIPLPNSRSEWRYARSLVWLYLRRSPLLAVQHLSRCLMAHPDSIPEAISGALYCLDQIWSYNCDSQNELSLALIPVYTKLIRLLPLISNPIIPVSSQLQGLRFCDQLGSNAFVNAVIAGKWELGLEEFEVVQGLCWSQFIRFRDPELEQIPDELARKLRHHMSAIRTSSMVGETSTAQRKGSLISLDAEYDHVTNVYELVRQVRAIPGLDRFMLGETINVLRSVASQHPVVALVGGCSRFYALVLRHRHAECILIPLSIRRDEIRSIASQGYLTRAHRGAARSESDVSKIPESQRGLGVSTLCQVSSTDRRMRYLWLNIVKPVLDALDLQPSRREAKPRLHWYPTGDFVAIPLHAAGVYDGPLNSRMCCADYVVSSYTPTLTTLLRAQKVAQPLQRSILHLALVAEKEAHESRLQLIHQVDAEVSHVAELAQSKPVKSVRQPSSPVTISETCAAMQTANIVHLACHSVQDPGNAIESGFCLGDGQLTISKLMQMKMNDPFLAFLSACETAKGDQNQPDQMMHLAAAMMFLGFKTVVATMWAIANDDGPMVARWFYEELFAHEVIDGDAVAYALDTAVRKLRESGVPLERWAPFIQMGI